MQPQSSKSTGRKSRSTKTCGRSRRKESGALTSSAEDSHAKTSASPEKVLALPVLGPVFGTSSLGSLASYDPATSSWRTSQRSLLEEWEPFSATFPRSGMTRNGTLYQLRPLVRRTGGSECGSLPTPTEDACIGCEPTPEMAERFRRKGRSGSFVEAMAAAMWPTPRVSDIRDGRTLNEDGYRVSPSGIYGANLADAVKMYPTPTVRDKQGKVPAMWPTPKASAAGPDFAKMTGRDNRKPGGGLSLATMAAIFPTPTVQDASNNGGPSQYERNSLPLNPVAGGALNPTWVEWLMGFPLGWTALDASATPSSRRSSKSSGEQSLTENGG